VSFKGFREAKMVSQRFTQKFMTYFLLSCTVYERFAVCVCFFVFCVVCLHSYFFLGFLSCFVFLPQQHVATEKSQVFLKGMTVRNDLLRSIDTFESRKPTYSKRPGRTGTKTDPPVVGCGAEVAERQAREKREYDEKIKRQGKAVRLSELHINIMVIHYVMSAFSLPCCPSPVHWMSPCLELLDSEVLGESVQGEVSPCDGPRLDI